MSNVVSIFGETVNPKAKDFEKLINEEIKESLEHFRGLMKTLIFEDKRSLRKKPHLNSKAVTTDFMVLHMINVELIESMFEEYLLDYGKTKYIKSKKAYFYSRVMPFFDKNLQDYDHLIDMNLCTKKFNDFWRR
tara:strand:+ start:288 stop:689 length:402 start_codon:yes stop_codon:yes gene_type:complete